MQEIDQLIESVMNKSSSLQPLLRQSLYQLERLVGDTVKLTASLLPCDPLVRIGPKLALLYYKIEEMEKRLQVISSCDQDQCDDINHVNHVNDINGVKNSDNLKDNLKDSACDTN